MNQKRTPAGIPTGGEFAANEHDEASAGLDDGTVAPPMCDRHGGEWGDDLTCSTCTDSDGNPRPVPLSEQDIDYGPGKYDTVGDAALWQDFAEGGLGGNGDVESPTGWFADYSPEDDKHYILREDDQGFATVERFDSEQARNERYSELDEQYTEWAESEDLDSIAMEVGESREAPHLGSELLLEDIDPYEAEDRASYLIGEDNLSATVKRVMPSDGSTSQAYEFEITGPEGKVTDRMFYNPSHSETPNLNSSIAGLSEAAWRVEMDEYEGYEDDEEELAEARVDDAKAVSLLKALVGEDRYHAYASGGGFERRFDQ